LPEALVRANNNNDNNNDATIFVTLLYQYSAVLLRARGRIGGDAGKTAIRIRRIANHPTQQYSSVCSIVNSTS
jgi:hypothetical protein